MIVVRPLGVHRTDYTQRDLQMASWAFKGYIDGSVLVEIMTSDMSLELCRYLLSEKISLTSVVKSRGTISSEAAEFLIDNGMIDEEDGTFSQPYLFPEMSIKYEIYKKMRFR